VRTLGVLQPLRVNGAPLRFDVAPEAFGGA
jgi:hypothetical protein